VTLPEESRPAATLPTLTLPSGPTWVDTHCHLDGSRYGDDRDAVVARAIENGVGLMISIGTADGPPDLEAGICMADRYSSVYASVGVHPHDASKADDATWKAIPQLCHHPKVLKVGEIGLDYHYDHSPRDVQRAVFVRQLEIAAELGLPVSIHTREAWADTVQCIREVWQGGGPGGIFHCFSEGPAEAAQGLELGFHLAFGGVVTFPKSDNVREAACVTPLDRILLETDAPYLAPIPFRGKRNEPAHIPRVGAYLAELLAVDSTLLRDAIWTNVGRLLFARRSANQ